MFQFYNKGLAMDEYFRNLEIQSKWISENVPDKREVLNYLFWRNFAGYCDKVEQTYYWYNSK